MKKILLSLLSISAVAIVAVAATGAFFSDTETSTGNTFQAGKLDLKIDAKAHYAGLTCTNGVWEEDVQGQSTRPDLIGDPCEGTWTEKDLVAGEDKFFDLTDIKPGDSGENTISLHVYDNDAWGRFVITDVVDAENTYLQEELDAGDGGAPNGELQENMLFSIWLDEGASNGFQCSPNPGQPGTPKCDADPTEGDNIFQPDNEPLLATPGLLDEGGEIHNIWTALAAVYTAQQCTGNGLLNQDPPSTCPGLNPDGRLISSITYFFGLAWELPDDVDNQAMTDSLSATLRFDAVQHRNNPSQLGF